MVIGCHGDLHCRLFVGQKSKCDFLGFFFIKKYCALHSKIMYQFKIFIVVKLEGIGGR